MFGSVQSFIFEVIGLQVCKIWKSQECSSPRLDFLQIRAEFFNTKVDRFFSIEGLEHMPTSYKNFRWEIVGTPPSVSSSEHAYAVISHFLVEFIYFFFF